MTDRARELVERLREGIGTYAPVLANALMIEAADFIEQSLMPPEGDTLSEGVVAQVAKTIHDAMVYAICEFKGEPQPWQNGNSTAESYARREAREILAALQSRVTDRPSGDAVSISQAASA